MRLLLGDCLDKLKELNENSIDSIVTDPPYGLAFMGKKWDYDVPSIAIWKECFRVLKPGGHLLAFAGSRTYHRMAVRIEDAGFEIRDQIMWLYGSGFPKSMNISKYIDKKFGTEKIVGQGKAGKTALGQSSGYNKTYNPHKYNITEPGSELAEEWNGWGTALKPAHEPIVMARKPLSEKTVVDNVLEWGTGGINIDDSRIGIDEDDPNHRHNPSQGNSGKNSMFGIGGHQGNLQPQGRFPANVIFDEEAGKILDEQSGVSKSSGGTNDIVVESKFGQVSNRPQKPFNYGDIGGASRFFYCPKTSKKDRNEGLDDFEEKQTKGSIGLANVGNTPTNTDGNRKRKNIHPTVKPTDLMLYLIRLVTPKGKTTLDPFMGSGSTGKASIRGGFDFIGIERELEYYDIAKARIKYETQKEKEKQKPDLQQKLF